MAIAATRPHELAYSELAAFSKTAPRLLLDRAGERPGASCVHDRGRWWSNEQLVAMVGGMQHRLRSAGVRPGDVVSMQLPNWLEAAVTVHAVWGLGAVLNPITPIYRGGELTAIFADCRPRAVVVPDSFRGTEYSTMARDSLSAAGVTADLVVLNAGGYDEHAFASADPVEARCGPDDIGVLMYTSGTTGSPKGVLHSHRTLLYEAGSIAARFGNRPERVFMPSPLTHITGLVFGVLMPLLTGGDLVLMDVWDAAAAAGLIEAHGCTASVGATPFLSGLLDAYRARRSRCALDWFVCGGADVPPSLIRESREVMKTVTVRAYGLTEMPTVTCGAPEDEVFVASETDGRPVGPSLVRLATECGAVGELEVSGPELFLGYADPADNSAAFTPDGWFRTGDLASIGPDGAVTIVGRSKDIIVRGGENISAKEVEDLLIADPAVSDVSVVGVPDPVLGERACAVVVPTAEPVELAHLVTRLEQARIAKQKFPEFVLLVDELPRTPSGKIQKFVLREYAARRLASTKAARDEPDRESRAGVDPAQCQVPLNNAEDLAT
ncbi:MAG: cyclohexanecarboxylate-CoA ligase [Pseudonocardiales bacterium]|nr:cyclohexanecarboxylate-CoA ligase [Pseudonocardiales bacterium]